jgi:hypothetical protein
MLRHESKRCSLLIMFSIDSATPGIHSCVQTPHWSPTRNAAYILPHAQNACSVQAKFICTKCRIAQKVSNLCWVLARRREGVKISVLLTPPALYLLDLHSRIGECRYILKPTAVLNAGDLATGLDTCMPPTLTPQSVSVPLSISRTFCSPSFMFKAHHVTACIPLDR